MINRHAALHIRLVARATTRARKCIKLFLLYDLSNTKYNGTPYPVSLGYVSFPKSKALAQVKKRRIAFFSHLYLYIESLCCRSSNTSLVITYNIWLCLLLSGCSQRGIQDIPCSELTAGGKCLFHPCPDIWNCLTAGFYLAHTKFSSYNNAKSWKNVIPRPNGCLRCVLQSHRRILIQIKKTLME